MVFKLETGEVGFILPYVSQFIISKDLFQIYVKPNVKNEEKKEDLGKLYDIHNLPEDVKSLPSVEKLIFNIISILRGENLSVPDKKPKKLDENFVENASRMKLSDLKNGKVESSKYRTWSFV